MSWKVELMVAMVKVKIFKIKLLLTQNIIILACAFVGGRIVRVCGVPVVLKIRPALFGDDFWRS